MTTNEIHQKLTHRFGDAVGPLSEPKLDPFAVVKPERLLEICRWLLETPEIALDHCNDVTAVDRPEKNLIEVVYHLFSYVHRDGITLKVELDRNHPEVPTVEGIWKAANFLEREVYDLFGVIFTGHSDLRRIMLPDDWVGHPLRKDYKEAESYHGVPTQRENPLVELRRMDEMARATRALEESKNAAPETKSEPPAGA